jgi:hypothetical protein
MARVDFRNDRDNAVSVKVGDRAIEIGAGESSLGNLFNPGNTEFLVTTKD